MTTEKGETRRRLALCRVLFASGYTIVERKRSGLRLMMLERRRKRRTGHPRGRTDWITVAAAKAKEWRDSVFKIRRSRSMKPTLSTVLKERRG